MPMQPRPTDETVRSIPSRRVSIRLLLPETASYFRRHPSPQVAAGVATYAGCDGSRVTGWARSPCDYYEARAAPGPRPKRQFWRVERLADWPGDGARVPRSGAAVPGAGDTPGGYGGP